MLPLDKEFTVLSFNRDVDKMTKEQAQEVLKDLFLTYIQQQESFKVLLAKRWGIYDK